MACNEQFFLDEIFNSPFNSFAELKAYYGDLEIRSPEIIRSNNSSEIIFYIARSDLDIMKVALKILNGKIIEYNQQANWRSHNW